MIAEYEADTIRDRTHSTLLELLRKGEIFVGHPPFGYVWNKKKKRLEQHPVESKTYIRLWKSYLFFDKSLATLANEFTAEKVPARRKGKGWHSATISNILHDGAHHTGIVTVRYNGETFFFQCEPLIPSHKWHEMIAKMRDAQTRAGRPALASKEFLLHRKLCCGMCGGKLGTRFGSRKLSDGSLSRWYSCTWHEQPLSHMSTHSRCSFRKVSAAKVEDYAVDGLITVPSHDFTSLEIPWKFNLPLLQEIVPLLPPFTPGPGNEDLDDEKNEHNQDDNDGLKGCASEDVHRPPRQRHPLSKTGRKIGAVITTAGGSGHKDDSSIPRTAADEAGRPSAQARCLHPQGRPGGPDPLRPVRPPKWACAWSKR